MPETANGTPPTNSADQIHVHKKESTKAIQAKQSKQTEERVVPKINRTQTLLNLMARCTNCPSPKTTY